jgi:VWFA-related protein
MLALLALLATSLPARLVAQTPAATFKANVELVRVSAVVRDRKGRFVQDLTVRDFEVLDGDQPRPITDFRTDSGGVSIALLFDVSGSMMGQLLNAREAAMHVLSWLDPARDEAAIFTFDTQLDVVAPFTSAFATLLDTMSAIVPYGGTSLHDAIGETAREVVKREGRRHAVVVFSDGNDNTSRLTTSEVSAMASAIDVPVYVIGIVRSIDNPSADQATSSVDHSVFAGPLADLANGTGGRVYVVSAPSQRSIAARQIVDELRHQYLIAFESSGKPGWHPLVVRARSKDFVVRARSGYIAGQSRPDAE